MQRSRRVAVPALTAVAGLVLASAVAGLAAGSAGAATPDRGKTGKTFNLQSGTTLSGYDAATTKNGTTYVAWIGDKSSTPGLRNLHLCVLKTKSKSCVGGVQGTTALGDSSAQNVKVVVSGNNVELVWIAQVDPDSGEFSGVFGTNVVSHNKLGTSLAVPGAPTLGTLTSAIAHKGGGVSIAAVGEVGTLDRRAYYYSTVSATPKTFVRPYFVGNAQLADNGKRTVLTTSAYGSLSGKVAVASKPSHGSGWTGFKNVAGSYTRGNIEQIVRAGKKIRMVGVSAKDIYTPDTWTFKGKSFGKAKKSGDGNNISSIDANSDGTGRLVTVDEESGGLMVANFAKGSHAYRFLFKVKQTIAGGAPQITTRSNGRGFLIWGIDKTGVTGQILRAQAIKVPMPPKHHHHHRGAHGHAGTFTMLGRL
ncbi:MAG TPA: hypothetical protein VHW64_09690 [Nocardioides sp.]|jgi:hypothetical protein|uniref:hypothetical protein n=1 Tax=Nocardioides sp. TaxID=35761 RepID=UPI002E32B24D|nr:hypothetical protein [Nocardioides sp.]HEX3930966.1 hypothetical protein [Nocardioides sp.]